MGGEKIYLVIILVIIFYLGCKSVIDYYHAPQIKQLKEIDQMTGKQFELYMAAVLRQLNCNRVRVTKYIGDQGIDVIATYDHKRIGIQCKRYKRYVGNKAVQEAYSGKSYYNLDKVYVITNSYFTKSAIELANRTGVILVNREDLRRLIKKIDKS